jgi:GAF domain-containing protein
MENLPDQHETARLDALRRYEILDTPAEEEYDAITRLAAHTCRAPVALISFVDAERQWFKSRFGLPVTETTRDVSVCLHAISQPGIFIVPDATEDARFAANPLVTGEPHIRFYAGAPLVNADGHALGTLCIIDYRARDLTTQEQAALQTLAAQVVRNLELRRRTIELAATNAALQAEMERRERAEAERAAAFSEMNLTIRERTADLRMANDFLREQIEERKRLFQSVETAKRIWEGTFDSIEQGVIVCDAAGASHAATGARPR